MMYLSRVRLDLNNLPRTELFKVLDGNSYAAHQLLWRLFPALDQTKESRPFLFRQEIEGPDAVGGKFRGLPLFYMLSTLAPADNDEILSIESREFAPQLNIGDKLAFKLRANPTVAIPTGHGKRSKREDVMMHAKYNFEARKERTSAACKQAMDEAARQWLERKGSNAGFVLPDIDNIDIGVNRQHQLYKKGRDKPIQFSSVDYEGVLEVSSPEALLKALEIGIGRAKAFGCGMLMVRRT